MVIDMYINKNSSKIIESLFESAGSNKITGKDFYTFIQNLEKSGYELDSSDKVSIEKHPNDINGEKVSLFNKDKKRFTAVFNFYSNNGRELVNIKASN